MEEKEIKPKKKEEFVLEDRLNWIGINGKYFSLIVIPDSTQYTYTVSDLPFNKIEYPSRFFITRPIVKSSLQTDSFRIYAGPNLKKELAKYNKAEDNKSGLIDLKLDKIIDTQYLGWLESLLKWILVLFYKMIPNYGVAIILLTILIKVIFFPVTKKSFESTSKMQAIQPKIQELQSKYKNDPQKLQKETAELYKKEGVNPMGGCLPMLLQMPILIALFGLLNRYFELRGAVFIPGWITDLSAPESVYSFAKGFTIPLIKVDITDIRLLPIIYIIVQFLTTFVTQAPSAKAQGNNMQTKILTYGMPIFFFFLFYNMPSGLLIYWTMTNLLSLLQQLLTNYLKNKKGNTDGDGKKPILAKK